jgi:uncharacterized protein YqjF (DUF2071 family)
MTAPIILPALFEQVYEHLLLVHWPVPEAALRAALPPGVEPVSFDDQFWVGHDVYVGSQARSLGVPLPPGFDIRPVITLRTIVDVNDKRGLYLLSMDAPGALPALAEGTFLGLRSHNAEVQIVEQPDGGVRVDGRRTNSGEELRASYGPVGPAVAPGPGSLELFLLGGDRLYAGDGRQLLAIDVVHGPWALSPATMTIEIDTIASSWGVPVPDTGMVAMYQRAQPARIGRPPSLL